MAITGKIIYGTHISQAQIDLRNSTRLAFADFEDDLGDLETHGFTQLPGEDIYYLGIGLAHVDMCAPLDIRNLFNRCVSDLTDENRLKVQICVAKLPDNIRNQLPSVGYYVIGEVMDVIKSGFKHKMMNRFRGQLARYAGDQYQPKEITAKFIR